MQMGFVASAFDRRNWGEPALDALRPSGRSFRVVAILRGKPISGNIGRLGASRLFKI
jgi:hypothetical protein